MTIDISNENQTTGEWIKLNPGWFGYYRVNYPARLIQRFLSSIEDKSMPPIDRLNIQSDHFAMVLSGKESTAAHLKLLLSYKLEDEYCVWKSIINTLEKVDFLTSFTSYHSLFHTYCRNFLYKIYQKIGWTRQQYEQHTDSLLRTTLINFLATFVNDSAFAASAEKRYLNIMSVAIDLRSVIFRTVGFASNDNRYQSFFTV